MAQTGVIPQSRSRTRRPRVLFRLGPMVLVSAAVLVTGWSLLWIFARHEAGRSFDTWLAAERDQGRVWSCPDRTIGGYPLSIEVRCTHPTFADARDPDALHGTIAGLSAVAHLYFPTNVVISLAGPARIQERTTGADVTLSWATARVSLRGDMPGELDRGQFEADAIEVAMAGGGKPTRIDHLELGFRPLPQTSMGPVDADVLLRISGASNPDADAAFGSDAPIETDATATITRLPNGSPGLPVLLDAWRRAGGDLQLKSFRFAKGGFTAAGEGHIEIDDEHRLNGRLDTRFGGLEPVAARFGIPIAAVKVGGLLSGLLGGKSAAQPGAAADLALPLVARNGRLSVGPVKTGVTLDPLY